MIALPSGSQELHGSNALNREVVATLQKVMLETEDTTTMLCAMVEGISDVDAYDEYARTNGSIFAPWASEFLVLSRAYTKDMARFRVLASVQSCLGGPASRPIDRMPVILCRGKGLLRWLLSEAYLGEGGNVFRRHSASAHTQVYALVGVAGTSCCNAVADDILQNATSEGASAAAYVIFERWADRAVDVENGITNLMGIHGGQRLVHASSLGAQFADSTLVTEWSPALHVVEGASASAFSLWRLPNWAEVDALATSEAFQAEINKAFQGRIVAFGFGNAASS